MKEHTILVEDWHAHYPGEVCDVSAQYLFELWKTAQSRGMSVLVETTGQYDEPVWREVLHIDHDTDGNLGGDPGDYVVSMPGESLAFNERGASITAVVVHRGAIS